MNILYSSIFLFVMILSCGEQPESAPEVTASPCHVEPDAGPCEAYFVKYYYDKNEGLCKSFIWGGCHGAVPFHSLEECKACIEDNGPVQ